MQTSEEAFLTFQAKGDDDLRSDGRSERERSEKNMRDFL